MVVFLFGMFVMMVLFERVLFCWWVMMKLFERMLVLIMDSPRTCSMNRLLLVFVKLDGIGSIFFMFFCASMLVLVIIIFLLRLKVVRLLFLLMSDGKVLLFSVFCLIWCV